jgi:hypothetical protein
MRKPTSKPRAKVATGAELGISSYDLPTMIMPRGERIAESYIATLKMTNRRRRIRTPGKLPIDMIQNLTEWIQKTKDTEARAYARRELRKWRVRLGVTARSTSWKGFDLLTTVRTKQLQNRHALPLLAKAETGSKRPTRTTKAQRGMAITAERLVRERGLVPRTKKDQLSALDRLWDLETT